MGGFEKILKRRPHPSLIKPESLGEGLGTSCYCRVPWVLITTRSWTREPLVLSQFLNVKFLLTSLNPYKRVALKWALAAGEGKSNRIAASTVPWGTGWGCGQAVAGSESLGESLSLQNGRVVPLRVTTATPMAVACSLWVSECPQQLSKAGIVTDCR